MRKIIMLLLLSLILYSCSSFSPGLVQYKDPVYNSGSLMEDSVFVYIHPMDVNEAAISLDETKFQKNEIYPIVVNIANRSDEEYKIQWKEIPGVMQPYEVAEFVHSSGFSHFILWSLPWGINLAAGAPIYYGIAFPIIGIIELVKSKNNNNRIDSFYERNQLPTNVRPNKTVQGMLFINRKKAMKNQILRMSSRSGNRIMFPFKLWERK